MKELVLEGENKYFDQQVCHRESVSDEEIEKFCEWLEELARENSETDIKIKKVNVYLRKEKNSKFSKRKKLFNLRQSFCFRYLRRMYHVI